MCYSVSPVRVNDVLQKGRMACSLKAVETSSPSECLSEPSARQHWSNCSSLTSLNTYMSLKSQCTFPLLGCQQQSLCSAEPWTHSSGLMNSAKICGRGLNWLEFISSAVKPACTDFKQENVQTFPPFYLKDRALPFCMVKTRYEAVFSFLIWLGGKYA